MKRRDFLQSATLVATAAGAATMLAAEVRAADSPAPMPVLKEGEPMTRRWLEQRWVVDNVIRANGVDWDQPRTVYLNAPCGFEAAGDFAGVRQRVQKYADIAPAFEAAARRREAKAHEAQGADQPVLARDNFFIAAVLWAAAQWPIDEANATNLAYNQKKRDCYEAYGKLADHHVETAWVPFQGKALPAWFHLPPGYQGGKIPAVWTIAGMDGCKEAGVALYGDRFLSRGIAVLTIDGPGSYESPLLGIYASVPNWQEAGPRDLCLARGARRDRPAEDRRRRRELRLVLWHHRRRGRAALRRGRGVRHLSRARLPHHLRGGLADLQEALHVHGRHPRRGEVRRVHEDPVTRWHRRQAGDAVSHRRRRSR